MEQNDESGLEKLANTLESVITGIPAPVKKNFLKAFGQLCTAAVDVPVAWLEGKASEIRASTSARVHILESTGERIQNELNIPKEYLAKASSKFASKIIKEQINLDGIILTTANELSNQEIKEENQTIEEISDDWLNEFESHARLKSSNEMNLIFSKILSGEISKPGTYSLRTIRLISQLDNDAARFFQVLCSLAISLHSKSYSTDTRVVYFDDLLTNSSLGKYGLSVDAINILQEYGLIIPEYQSYHNYSDCIRQEEFKQLNNKTICFQKRHYVLTPTFHQKTFGGVYLLGIVLTKAGKELLEIIPSVEQEQYKKDLTSFLLSKHHMKLIELTLS